MPKYTDTELLKRRIYEHRLFFAGQDVDVMMMNDIIDEMPAADVEPVRHGHWEKYKGVSELNGYGTNFRCSACRKFHFHNGELRRYKFCPNCGARMDGGEEL